MRKASIVLAFTACAASSLALAQQQDLSTDVATRSTTAMTNTAAGDGNEPDDTGRGKSGFGQIMSVLTGLLQDAAAKESVRASATASETLSSADSAVTITVTPVAGRSTFFVGKPPRHKPALDTPLPRSATATSSTRIATATIDADAAPAQIAMQPQGERPD